MEYIKLKDQRKLQGYQLRKRQLFTAYIATPSILLPSNDHTLHTSLPRLPFTFTAQIRSSKPIPSRFITHQIIISYIRTRLPENISSPLNEVPQLPIQPQAAQAQPSTSYLHQSHHSHMWTHRHWNERFCPRCSCRNQRDCRSRCLSWRLSVR